MSNGCKTQGFQQSSHFAVWVACCCSRALTARQKLSSTSAVGLPGIEAHNHTSQLFQLHILLCTRYSSQSALFVSADCMISPSFMLGLSSLHSNPMATTLMLHMHPSSYCASSMLQSRTAPELTWLEQLGRLGHFRAAANLVKSSLLT